MELLEITNSLARLEKLIPETELRTRLAELDGLLSQADWSNPQAVQSQQQEHKHLRQTLDELEYIRESFKHLQELNELLQYEKSDDLKTDYEQALTDLSIRLKSLLIVSEFTGPHDRGNAIVTIRVGQGGTDAQDWVEMLARMYTKYATKHEWETQTIDQQYGNEAGSTEIVMEVNGLFAYGYLKNEHGIHRLVRISPFNAGGTRETSFASVEVIPKFDEVPIEIVINDSDLEWKTFRASGPGGQYTNKTSTAVQLIHHPSGISVRSSSLRSQAQNREKALLVLKNKLWLAAEEKRLQAQSALKGPKQSASWGQQTRNYVLHPYQLVKDIRTGQSSNRVHDILEGELDLLRA
jgi:peptide chain release factor 2